MSDDAKVRIEGAGGSFETTVGEMKAATEALSGVLRLATVLGEEVEVPREAIEELLARHPILRRPKFRTLTALTRKHTKQGDVWVVKGEWATATKTGSPDTRELSVRVAELPSERFLASVRNVERLVADLGGLAERLMVRLEAWMPNGDRASEFKLQVREPGEAGKIAGAAVYQVSVWSSAELRDEMLELERLAWGLADGDERVKQTELAL